MRSASYAGVSALVLGASGFIGAWVARRLHAAGARVHAVGRDRVRVSGAVGEAAADIITADLSHRGAVLPIIESVRPAIVFNLAGYGVDRVERDPAMMVAINANLVAELCERLSSDAASSWSGLRLIHVGSALEYGMRDERLHEELPPNPTTDYGRSKLEGTDHVKRHGTVFGLRGATARLFTVYGPGEHPDRLLPSLRRLVTTDERLPLTSGIQRRDFTFVDDVAEGLLRIGLSDVPPGEVLNLATGQLTSVRAFAETAATILGIDSSRLDFGALPTREEEMFHGDVDIRRLRTILSWSPATSVADGIRRTMEFRIAH
jgi:UDP-glucose 4-epimerase